MHQYQKDFVDFSLEVGALKFGEWTLKSGRVSPYFFNAGAFNSGEHLAKLGKFYAAAILQSGVDFDLIFGPAYKGIPLVATTAIALFEDFGKSKPYSFNRKESKNHGEGGEIVGHPLGGKVLIIDDVITKGLAIREAMAIIKSHNATTSSVVVAVDRQERGESNMSAIEELKKQGINVFSIINLTQLITYVEGFNDANLSDKIKAYRDKYGI